jgi:hypothetical protein
MVSCSVCFDSRLHQRSRKQHVQSSPVTLTLEQLLTKVMSRKPNSVCVRLFVFFVRSAVLLLFVNLRVHKLGWITGRVVGEFRSSVAGNDEYGALLRMPVCALHSCTCVVWLLQDADRYRVFVVLLLQL